MTTTLLAILTFLLSLCALILAAYNHGRVSVLQSRQEGRLPAPRPLEGVRELATSDALAEQARRRVESEEFAQQMKRELGVLDVDAVVY